MPAPDAPRTPQEAYERFATGLAAGGGFGGRDREVALAVEQLVQTAYLAGFTDGTAMTATRVAEDDLPAVVAAYVATVAEDLGDEAGAYAVRQGLDDFDPPDPESN